MGIPSGWLRRLRGHTALWWSMESTAPPALSFLLNSESPLPRTNCQLQIRAATRRRPKGIASERIQAQRGALCLGPCI